ncbi:UNVERIFIED_CONTAM: hypothetical protein PYX00_004084 [Menopon gallinae]|uniref:3',5'-cyclic-GMP phosphodiesterase n=1 Tax=Menopon gallinae TaxID=328185 RepID=A0AAW2I2W7_9NEOP
MACPCTWSTRRRSSSFSVRTLRSAARGAPSDTPSVRRGETHPPIPFRYVNAESIPEPGTTVSAYVAYVQDFVCATDILGDPRFPEGIPGVGRLAKSVLCVPALTRDETEVIAIIELYRKVNEEQYTLDEIQMVITMTGWIGAAVQLNNEKLFYLKESELNKYFINLLQLFFNGVVPFDKLVTDIVMFAKKTVGAERGSFYTILGNVVENTNDDILTEVYEEGLDTSQQIFKKKALQRFCKNCPGIAGYAARTGKVIVVEDAYEDERFNKAQDILGFRSRTIISVPIKNSLNVFGVLTLFNKFPRFTQRDEHMLETFASYCLLACQFKRASEDLQKTLHRYNGHNELLVMHVKPCTHDLEAIKNFNVQNLQIPRRYFGFDWFIGNHEKHAIDYVVYSFEYCLGSDFFDRPSLWEFALLARKSYRQNPYHNFAHAFTVFHCAFNIIVKNPKKFTMIEKTGLLIATLLHDSDHFGYTNTFLVMTGNWLAKLYEESCLEHHHIDMCMMFIEITNLFVRIAPEEIQELRRLIEQLILSTDPVSHFKVRGFLANLIKTGAFEWENYEHRLAYMENIMACADLSGQCKPFSVVKQVTASLYKEFYNQGDMEKELGLTPLSMMNREKQKLIPADQIKFLTIICLPMIEILVAVLPNTELLLKMCLDVIERWKMLKDKQEKNLWWPEESHVAL